MKTSALRRWLVLLGLIARDQTTRLTGGYDGKMELEPVFVVEKKALCQMLG